MVRESAAVGEALLALARVGGSGLGRIQERGGGVGGARERWCLVVSAGITQPTITQSHRQTDPGGTSGAASERHDAGGCDRPQLQPGFTRAPGGAQATGPW